MLTLVQRPITTFELSERIIPAEFYLTGPDRYVFHDYHERIARGVPALEVGTSFAFTSVEISGDSAQRACDIEPFLPREHVFAASTVCGIGTSPICLQQGGAPGEFDTAGANLLFTAEWVVWIYFDSMNNKWTFSTWPRSGDAFRTIRRAFFPAP